MSDQPRYALGEALGERRTPLVGFVIAGAQKAGTTTLYGALRTHPHIARSKFKELHFFDDDRRDWHVPDYAAYERGIAVNPRATIAGEASPSYLFWPQAMARMHAYNPDMKIIGCFRDPIERAFSQWSMNRGRDATHPDFAVAIRSFAPRSLPADVEEAGGRTLSYVTRGYYGAQMARALEYFDRDQVLCLDFHTAFDALAATLDTTTDFLGLPRFETHPVAKRNRAQPSGLTGEPPTAADVSFLAERFGPDLENFARLTGVDVSGWATKRVVQGHTAPADLASSLARKAGLAGS